MAAWDRSQLQGHQPLKLKRSRYMAKPNTVFAYSPLILPRLSAAAGDIALARQNTSLLTKKRFVLLHICCMLLCRYTVLSTFLVPPMPLWPATVDTCYLAQHSTHSLLVISFVVWCCQTARLSGCDRFVKTRGSMVVAISHFFPVCSER
jgi:hypothetical protein